MKYLYYEMSLFSILATKGNLNAELMPQCLVGQEYPYSSLFQELSGREKGESLYVGKAYDKY